MKNEKKMFSRNQMILLLALVAVAVILIGWSIYSLSNVTSDPCFDACMKQVEPCLQRCASAYGYSQTCTDACQAELESCMMQCA